MVDDNRKIAIYSSRYGEIDYDKFESAQIQFVEMIDNTAERPLLLIKCNISYETVVGYTASITAKIPVIMCDGISARKTIGAYLPQYIWQQTEAETPYGYESAGHMFEFTLYRRIGKPEYRINDELAVLLSTSGTTGSSRYVRISYNNIRSNTISIIKSLGIDNSGIAGVMLPLNYTYGLSVINTYLYVGGSLVIGGTSVMQKSLWDYFMKCNVNAISGVPDTYEMLRAMKTLEKESLNLKLVTQAGGRLNYDTEKYLLELSHKRGFNLAIMYGQTEATARMTCHFLNDNPRHIGSVGLPIADGVISIENSEIVYHGPNVSMGYADGYGDLAAPDDNKGILHTGDLGRIDDEGFLYITGRIKRFAKAAGVRVNLDELENIIEHYCNVRSACIEKEGRIVVILAGNKVMNVSDTISRITGINRRFIEIINMDKLPVNTNGKTDYGRCCKIAEHIFKV